MAATFLRKQIIEIFSKCRMFQLICQDSGKTRPRDGDDERNANRKDKSLGFVHGKKVLLNWDVGGVAQKIRSFYVKKVKFDLEKSREGGLHVLHFKYEDAESMLLRSVKSVCHQREKATSRD